MAPGRGADQPSGMTVTRPASAPPELGPALRRAMILLAPAASAFAVGAFMADFVFADPAMGRIAAVLAVGAAIFGIAWRLLQRGFVRPAALLLTVVLLVLPVLFAAVQPIFASYPLVPLLGVAFALPFLESRRLAALMGLACVSTALTAAIQSVAPPDALLPGWFFVTFNVLGLLALVVVFLILLAAFSNRLHRSLRQANASAVALADQATHDSLTGLANRRAVLARAQAVLDGPAVERIGAAVLYIDIDEFKRINDTLGHLAGDALLERVGQRIADATPIGMTARPGGDEFVVIVIGPADEDAAARVAVAITAALAVPFSLRGRDVRVSASIGIARLADAATAEEILARADAAMYTAKRAGKGLTALFDPAMFAALQARLELEGELRRALEADELHLEYQPIIQLSTGRIVDLEALLRWDHPAGRHIGPTDFIPVAEESGLIVPLGRFVLRRALADLRAVEVELGGAWRATMSVNLSTRQLADPGLVDGVRAELADAGVAGSALRLEITETAMLVGLECAADTIAALRSLGASVVIDDFGTGYSALDYLKRFVVDGVKIDRSFTPGLGRLGPDEAIVTASIAFAHALGLEVTAEGIETQGQLDRLTELGCDRGQGYLVGRPTRIENVVDMLRADLARPRSLTQDIPGAFPPSGDWRRSKLRDADDRAPAALAG
jgi:diguanylate cyclase (GGDEF)-like protein